MVHIGLDVLGPLRKANAYDRAAIDELRVNTDVNRFDPRTSYWFYGIGSGSVAFDYGRRTIRVADVDEAEAKRVVDALASARLPVGRVDVA